jgi:hypothetical protein
VLSLICTGELHTVQFFGAVNANALSNDISSSAPQADRVHAAHPGTRRDLIPASAAISIHERLPNVSDALRDTHSRIRCHLSQGSPIFQGSPNETLSIIALAMAARRTGRPFPADR